MRAGLIAAATALLALVGCQTGAARPEPARSFPDAPAADRRAVVAEIEKRRAADPQSVDEFDEMILVTNMDGRQLGAFQEAVKDRKAKYEAYSGGPEGQKLAAVRKQLAEARAARDEAKTADLQKQLEPLDRADMDYRTKIRAPVVEIMDLDQQRDWAAYVLWGRWGGLNARFQGLGLTDEQMKKAQAVCRAEMNDLIKPGTLRNDPYLMIFRRRGENPFKDRVAARIGREVLSEDQREMLTFASAPRADRKRVVADIEKRRAADARSIDEFDEMILATDMDGRQLGAFQEAVKQRQAKLQARGETAEAKRMAALKDELAKARTANDQKKVEDLQKQMDPLAEAEKDFRTQIRVPVVEVMTLRQQRDWAAYVLWGGWGGLGGRFRAAQLSDEQVAKAKALCRAEMDTLIRPDTMAKDPYLWCIRTRDEASAKLKDRVAQRIAQEVLTAEQRQKIAA
jgi:hypothetical protein